LSSITLLEAGQQKYGTITEILKDKGELNDISVDPCYDIFSLSSCVEFTFTFVLHM